MEGLCYYFVYRNDEYQSIVAQVDRYAKQADKQKLELDTAATDKKSKKKANRAEDQLKRLYAQLMPYNLRLTLVNFFVLIGAYQVFSASYDGIVVAKLPFVPFGIFQGLTHRNLPGDDFTDASAHLIFAMGLLLSRTNVQKLLELKKIRPVQPQMMNTLMDWQQKQLQ